MSPTRRWVFWAFGVPAAAYFLAMALEVDWLRFFAKPIPVLVLAGAVWTTEPRTRFRVFVSLGLLFGAAGDLILELGHFVPGLIAFLIGHLWYLAALLGRNRRPALGLAAIFAVWAVGLPWLLADGVGDLLVPIAVYAVVLCSAMWRSGALLSGGVAHHAAVALFVGFITFGVSDSLIAINRFGTDIPGDRWLIMTTYWAAQALIAWGAIRSDDDGATEPATD